MRRFRTITAICLTAIAIMVAGNIWYLYDLYNSIKEQTLHTVSECVRRADILEIITRLNGTSHGDDDSFIKLTLVVQGEKTPTGEYDYPNLLDNLNQTMSQYFHVIEQSGKGMAERNYARLDSIFKKELNNSGLSPEKASICPIGNNADKCDGLWSIDFAMPESQQTIYKVCFSPMNGHILRQMSGIILTSAAILILMSFLIWYLLHWVGKLRTIEQMKDDFTHNMTHELKTPVAVAYSAADSMLRYYDQSDEARNKQFLRIIMQRLSYLSGMIENILSMSMERFKTIKLNIEDIALKPIVEDISGMMELKAVKPVEIDIDIPDNISIQADSLHLGNILSNLIDNALKYSGDSVHIIIKADAHSITISDNGVGIDKENLPFIFDKFYRVPSGDRYEVGGYGLGLFYVRQITELMGWDIDVASKPGQGTKFTIRFDGNEKR
ncbi:MAG: HAMP domain-containing sensor histidine kinase [bacterium]|jgi:sensor protein rprX|nr:HAMP domain-containing sensor histidine kinase [bacterium]